MFHYKIGATIGWSDTFIRFVFSQCRRCGEMMNLILDFLERQINKPGTGYFDATQITCRDPLAHLFART